MKLSVWACTKYIKSEDRKIIDVEEDLGIDLEDWKEMDESAKSDAVFEYVQDQHLFEWGYEEVE